MKKKKTNQKTWQLAKTKPQKVMPSSAEMLEIKAFFEPMVQKFKEVYIVPNPNKNLNYTVDIYTEWYRNAFYLKQKMASEQPNRPTITFDVPVVKLEYLGTNCFKFSYFRHTGTWFPVAEGISKEDALEMIQSNPVFRPI